MAKAKPFDRIVQQAKKAIAAQDQLEFGRLIASESDLHGMTTSDLASFAARIGCSLRTARYAEGVYRLAKKVGLSGREVSDIGWTKLAVMAANSNDTRTKAELVAFCAGRTVTELRAALAGKVGTMTISTFTLNKGQRAELEAKLIRFGATRVGQRLLGKEAALMKMVANAG
jgi:hypothetical protein